MNDVVEAEVLSEVQSIPKKWYSVQTHSNKEKSVLAALLGKIELSGLSSSFGQIVLAEEQVVEVVNGVSKRTTRKFYPGYLFIEMAFDEKTWHLIKSTPKVLGFIGGSQTKPSPITQKEMDVILNRIKETQDAPARKQEFAIGQTVLIIDGPFKDFEGTVEDINYNKNKLRVSIAIFGRATPTDMEFGQVTKIG